MLEVISITIRCTTCAVQRFLKITRAPLYFSVDEAIQEEIATLQTEGWAADQRHFADGKVVAIRCPACIEAGRLAKMLVVTGLPAQVSRNPREETNAAPFIPPIEFAYKGKDPTYDAAIEVALAKLRTKLTATPSYTLVSTVHEIDYAAALFIEAEGHYEVQYGNENRSASFRLKVT